MSSKLQKQIDCLWEQMQDAIAASYKAAHNGGGAEDRLLLRDYAPNVGWTDKLEQLLQRETAHERRHRGLTTPSRVISSRNAAKLLILENMARGASEKEMPSAIIFLSWRDTAAESCLIGYLARAAFSPDWLREACALDYSTAVTVRELRGEK